MHTAQAPFIAEESEVRERIEWYIAAHRYLNLATVSPGGRPLAHTVLYAAVGPVVYFLSERNSRKVRDIAADPRVAYTISEDYTNLYEIQGVQVEGEASLVDSPDESARAVELISERMPDVARLRKEGGMAVVRIIPDYAYFMDYTGGEPRRFEARFHGVGGTE